MQHLSIRVGPQDRSARTGANAPASQPPPGNAVKHFGSRIRENRVLVVSPKSHDFGYCRLLVILRFEILHSVAPRDSAWDTFRDAQSYRPGEGRLSGGRPTGGHPVGAFVAIVGD